MAFLYDSATPGNQRRLDAGFARTSQSNMSSVVYRLVHPPVTRESGVRLPAEEDTFFSGLYQVDEGLPVDARSDLL